MIDVSLDQLPAEDHDLVREYSKTHAGAIVLRVGDLLGSEAGRAFVAYKKANDYTDPPHDFVWCEA